jgi:hypothetical protein
MMRYFDRVCQIDISPDIRVDNLRIKFEIKKNIISNINSCRVDIYNLSPETRNKITSDPSSLVIVEAGYEQNGGLSPIGQGNISNVLHTIKNPDIITTIYSKDGFNAIYNNPISLSFIGKTPLSSVINAIITKLRLPIRYIDYDKAQQFKNGFSYVGLIPVVLDRLGNQFKFKWSIQNGQLQILNKDKSTNNQFVLLSANTGLIETPELIIKTKDLNNIKTNEYIVVSLLQPQLEAGDLVQLESKVLNGTFKIKELTHRGDTIGTDWYTKMIITKNG